MACRLVGAKPLSEPVLEYCLIRPLGTIFSEILIKSHTFSFKKMQLKMLPAKRRPFCLGLNVLLGNDFSYQCIRLYIWAIQSKTKITSIEK